MSAQKVPINPKVLEWAIVESGHNRAHIAKRAKVDKKQIRAWLSGDDQPSLTQCRALAAAVRRPLATLLLPAPPTREPKRVEFRHPPDATERELNAPERLRLREATWLQRELSWVLREVGTDQIKLPAYEIAEDSPEEAAAAIRRVLKVRATEQQDWPSDSAALHGWREALERLGIHVLLLPMGPEASRGFSVFDEHAPVIAANTHWNNTARIFTLFHELGHLITRTNSVCEEGVYRHKRNADPVERWCEEFAASVLLPWKDVTAFLSTKCRWQPGTQINDLAVAGKLARRFKVSLRASTIRLIQEGAAGWDLYRALPKNSDHKTGGGGGTGRDRTRIRLDEYGKRTALVFVHAVDSAVLSRDDAQRYLRLADSEFDSLASEVSQTG